MGKPTGFLEYGRCSIKSRPVANRLKDWQELQESAPLSMLREQAARCMECGVPYCQTGELYGSLALGCPLANLIPEWNDLVYNNRWQEALQRLHKTNNFPEFTGRVCPAPCEGSCTVGLIGQPVTIKAIEAAIADKGWNHGWVKPQKRNKKVGYRSVQGKVAVIGSGPAGLACADELNKAGCEVTVFEREDRIGGLLMYGIPNMKLDKDIVQRRINLMASEGIRFTTRTEVVSTVNPGRTTAQLTLAQLKNDFDAVVLCCGSTVPRDLDIPGREATGIHWAMDFLRENTRQLLDNGGPNIRVSNSLAATGKDVIIIGGGDTGTDCAATALRHRCRSVTQLEIMPQPPAERPRDNPWPQWPKVLRSDYGQEEATFLQGQDPREYSRMSTHFSTDSEGHVEAVHTIQVEWKPGPDGRFQPVPTEGTEQVYPAQLVLLAMGFTGPEPELPQGSDLTWRKDGEIHRTWRESFATNKPGIFVAGDMRRGQSLVVWAIAEGRGAAAACREYLENASSLAH